MLDPLIKEELGYDPDDDDEIVLSDWKERVRIVCKPCWELKYCPYGPLVEEFPLFATSRAEAIEDNKENNRRLENREIADERIRLNVKKMTENFDPLRYPEELPPKEIMDCSCTEFGHICPVYFVAEPFTETEESRRITDHIPRPIVIKVVRRDNSQCQICGRPLLAEEIEIDHIIPKSKGGPSDINNLRVVCEKCNKSKTDKITFLRKK